MGARRRSGGDSGFAAVFLVVLVVGVIIKYFWWIVGAAALVGAFIAARAIARAMERKRIEAAARDAELTRRADLQHRWTLRGDSRGVYGPEGAKAMRTVAPTPEVSGMSEPPEQSPEVSAVACTAADLTRLLSERSRVGDGPRSLRCWFSDARRCKRGYVTAHWVSSERPQRGLEPVWRYGTSLRLSSRSLPPLSARSKASC
jgi:hypothetical protein